MERKIFDSCLPHLSNPLHSGMKLRADSQRDIFLRKEFTCRVSQIFSEGMSVSVFICWTIYLSNITEF